MSSLDERRRANYARRLIAIRKRHNMPTLSRIESKRILDAIQTVRGEGIPDADLRVLIRLTQRGLSL